MAICRDCSFITLGKKSGKAKCELNGKDITDNKKACEDFVEYDVKPADKEEWEAMERRLDVQNGVRLDDIKADNVNHPAHYCRDGAMECFDEMILVFGNRAVANYCVINAWKCRYRAADKNGAEDLAKSDWYMNKAKELGYGNR